MQMTNCARAGKLDRTYILDKCEYIPMSESRQGGAPNEIEVTPEMIEAGRDVLCDSGLIDFGASGSPLGCEGAIAADIYRAMRSLEKP